MAGYLLDSNAFLRAKAAPEALRAQARKAVEDPGNTLYVSLACLWELAIKAALGKLDMFARLTNRGERAVMSSLTESGFDLLPVDLSHVLEAAALPMHHRDPFDRLMIAQALQLDLTVITSDDAFSRYSDLHILAA